MIKFIAPVAFRLCGCRWSRHGLCVRRPFVAFSCDSPGSKQKSPFVSKRKSSIVSKYSRIGEQGLGYKKGNCFTKNGVQAVPNGFWQVWTTRKEETDIFLVIALFVTKRQYKKLMAQDAGSPRFGLKQLQDALRHKFSSANKYYRANNIRVVIITFNRFKWSTE